MTSSCGLAALPLYRTAKSDEEPPEPSATEELYADIFRVLRRSTGVDFGGYKRPTIARRVARRMALCRVQTLAEYLDFLNENVAEVATLAEDVLIHVTSFFREPDSFAALANSVLPNLLRERGESPLRIWVPGCASGEEVYSLAITLFESFAEDAELVPLQIFGTDVSKTSVERARAGVYAEAIAAEVSPERLRRFFSKSRWSLSALQGDSRALRVRAAGLDARSAVLAPRSGHLQKYADLFGSGESAAGDRHDSLFLETARVSDAGPGGDPRK